MNPSLPALWIQPRAKPGVFVSPDPYDDSCVAHGPLGHPDPYGDSCVAHGPLGQSDPTSGR